VCVYFEYDVLKRERVGRRWKNVRRAEIICSITERNVEGRFEDERKKELCRKGRVAARKSRKFRKEWNILEVDEVTPRVTQERHADLLPVADFW
jgi:hypothetical protein